MHEHITEFCSYFVCARSCYIRQEQTWSFNSLLSCLVRHKLGLQMFPKNFDLHLRCFLYLICWLNLHNDDFAIEHLDDVRFFDLIIAWIPSLAAPLFAKTYASCIQNLTNLPATTVYFVVQKMQFTRKLVVKVHPSLYLNAPGRCSWIPELYVCSLNHFLY